MNQPDTYYRALRALRAVTAADKDCDSLCRALTAASDGQDSIRTRQFVCEIDEDWVSAIERGLTCIDKALREERQFIQSEGEVMEIEKVKHVSKETVVHLARHSEMITREPDEDGVIPDKLYTVERLNDYTVYENRFLYLLLCCLRDFVSLRYTDILALSGRYEGRLEVDRAYRTRGRSIKYRVSLEDAVEEDAYLRDNNACAPVLDRLDLILKAVLAFLHNPIMECCAKVAVIRPPITKTNVLRMNNNFRGAVELYEYIMAYDKDGYSIKPVERTVSPLSNEAGLGISEAGLLSAFLTYAYGLGLENDLRRAYEAEEERRLQAELVQRQEQLERLRRRLANADVSVEDYVAELEAQNKGLEKQALRVPLLIQELQEKQIRIGALTDETHALHREIVTVTNACERQKADMQAACAQRLAVERDNMSAAMAEQASAHSRELTAVREAYESRLSELTAALEAKDAAHAEQVAALNRRQAETQAALEAKTAAYDTLTADHTAQTEQLTLAEARLLAVRSQTGQVGADESYTTQQDFDRLEAEYKALQRYYKSQWKAAKRSIRRTLLTVDNFKNNTPDAT